jgi:excisionase family DNA binding protein
MDINRVSPEQASASRLGQPGVAQSTNSPRATDTALGADVGTALATIVATDGIVGARRIASLFFTDVHRIADALERIAARQPLLAEGIGRAVPHIPSESPAGGRSGDQGPVRATSISAVNSQTDGMERIEAQLVEVRDTLKKLEQSMRPAEKDFYTVEEAAEITPYAAWTLRRACHDGRITALKSPNGQWRIAREEVIKITNQGLPK